MSETFFFPYSRICSGLYGSESGKRMTSGETTADGGVHVVFNDEDLVFEEEILRNPYRWVWNSKVQTNDSC